MRQRSCQNSGSKSYDSSDGSERCSSVAAADSSGILCCSLNHAPRSMSRHRSLQKGRYTEAGDHSTGRRQVGHLKMVVIEICPDSGAARQMKRYIHFNVHGTAGGIQPVQKSNGATMLAAADLGK